ncbi:unnamed protein product, partial [Porites lobata]
SFPAFVNRSYYCLDCERGFNTDDRTNHTCQGRRCSACGRFDCPEYVRGTRPTEYCCLCYRKFYGHQCKRYHEISKQCQSIKICLKCQAQYTVVRNQRHRCGYAKCPACQEWVSIQNHKCYIQPVEDEHEETEPTEEGGGSMVAPPPPLFVYADFEAMQNAEGVFVANLLCYSSSVDTTIHVLDGEDCALQFLRDLDDLTDVPDCEGEREILVVFHNLKGFDGMFILHELYQQQREVVDQLTVGAKVLSFRSGPLKFIDSLCFLPMPLASFSSTFNLTELKKGFFPHLFNTPDHQQYVGRIPDLEFYDPDGMMAKKERGTDSACNLYWRKHHLTPDTIAVEPLGGWRGAQVNHSLKALQWLYYQEHLLPKEGASADRIRHVRNGGEQSVRTSVDSHFVDGYDPVTRTVYEFHGCLYHGCPRCYPARNAKHYATPDRTVEELYQATLSKRTALLRAGYTVIEMWECEWDRLVDTDEAVQHFLNSFDLVAPLEPREAFFGGRTGAVALHAVAGEGEEIRYVDVTSLYPWVNKNCPYPIGHPRITTQPADQSLDSYFGLATVDILPPAGLFHPVLPVRSGNKLTFPLCRACVQTEQAQPMLTRTRYCPHSDADRTLRGTWCTPELVKAVEKGYTLIKIHEVWHFPPEQRQTGLFADYVNTWLKLKQESAGWPGWYPAQLFNLISDAALDLSTLRLCTDDILEAVYTSVQDNAVKGTKTNIFVAAFTTCHARLKLYESLDTLQQQVLYYDTDSVVYKWRPGQPSIATGDFLGDMTDELDGDVITEFVSGGAKNYGYQTRGGKVVCKVRGFTLNVRGSAILNFQTMKENILSELDSPQESRRNLNITNPYYFQRDLEQKQIQVVPRVK